jgi:hypothetical protein
VIEQTTFRSKKIFRLQKVNMIDGLAPIMSEDFIKSKQVYLCYTFSMVFYSTYTKSSISQYWFIYKNISNQFFPWNDIKSNKQIISTVYNKGESRIKYMNNRVTNEWALEKEDVKILFSLFFLYCLKNKRKRGREKIVLSIYACIRIAYPAWKWHGEEMEKKNNIVDINATEKLQYRYVNWSVV